MKPFTLFFGASDEITTYEVTHNPSYELVMHTVNHLRDRLLKEQVLRVPFLHIFTNCYNDDSEFPRDLAPCTPVADRVSNLVKIRRIREHPPTDADVVEFLTNAFPDLYLAHGDFGPEGVSWVETMSGREEADSQKITINGKLVLLWLQIVNTPITVGPARLSLMFIAIFLHELAHSALVWYGRGVCDSPQIGGIEREGGNYVEQAFFGGITLAEFELEPMQLVEIGIQQGASFYIIENDLAKQLVRFDTSNGLPLLDITTLSPSPPATFGRVRAKFNKAMSNIGVLPAPKKMSATRAQPLLKNDKKRRMV
ncbi:uncharacterized protein LACBIDRAFT_295499 [Laccaria bicolor S238N-H82]|uniref:Predicted protein n=1 Tax=Laccaria bicolor (strain S238N-H82 / ATCC MYA-4686) TaxID=486041 RepID=B0DTF3_LACBS|nr:uncharacterized protein LACBIDRAFT_295499 [Laccaria bicolor S238N-H82]EDR02102.1 predicted protein [Laccaria bicolor S238N-H82]|eukprot:XP_001887259.1 predicted protein [Laccaria bicolor S238N-H82]